MQKNLIIQNNVIEQDEFFLFDFIFGLQPYIGLPFIFQTDVQPICLLFSLYIF